MLFENIYILRDIGIVDQLWCAEGGPWLGDLVLSRWVTEGIRGWGDLMATTSTKYFEIFRQSSRLDSTYILTKRCT